MHNRSALAAGFALFLTIGLVGCSQSDNQSSALQTDPPSSTSSSIINPQPSATPDKLAKPESLKGSSTSKEYTPETKIPELVTKTFDKLPIEFESFDVRDTYFSAGAPAANLVTAKAWVEQQVANGWTLKQSRTSSSQYTASLTKGEERVSIVSSLYGTYEDNNDPVTILTYSAVTDIE